MLFFFTLSAFIPKEGQIAICSEENNVTVWLYRGDEFINTYLFNYGNLLTITLKPCEYKCQFRTGSGREGVVEIELNKREYLKVQIPPPFNIVSA